MESSSTTLGSIPLNAVRANAVYRGRMRRLCPSTTALRVYKMSKKPRGPVLASRR